MNKQFLEDNYKYFKLDRLSDDDDSKKNIENFAIDASTKENQFTEESREKIRKINDKLNQRLIDLKNKKDIIKNRNKIFDQRKKMKKERREKSKNKALESKSFFKGFLNKNKSTESDKIYDLAHSFEFRKRDIGDSVYDQLDPNSLFDFFNIGFDQNDGAIFNGINGYAVSREELPAQKEVSIELFIKLMRPKSDGKGGMIFLLKSKEDLTANHLLAHSYKSYTETPQGYKGKTKEGQGYFVFNSTGMGSQDFNPSDPMADALNIDSDTHIVMTCNNNGQVKYYKNGNLIFTRNTNKKFLEKPKKLFLGVGSSSGKNYDPHYRDVNYPNMRLRYFRIYNKVLNKNQIKNLYNNRTDVSYIDTILNIPKNSLIKLSASKKEDGKFAEKDDFNKELRKQEIPFYLLYTNPGFGQSDMQNIIYKRLTPIDDVDMFTLLHIDWFDAAKGIKNTFNVDFELYSDIESAVSSTNRWKFCNFNDPGVGFMRDCGINGYVGGHWISLTRSNRGYNWKNWSFSLYKLSERQKFAQKLFAYNKLLIEIEKEKNDLAFYNEKGLIAPVSLSNYMKDGAYQDKTRFNEFLRTLPLPFFIVWENPISPNEKYKNIIYKRLTSVNKVDIYDLFHVNWFDHNKGVKNKFNHDFELYSDINHAIDERRIKKIKIVNNGHLEILEIQVWINGVNVVQNIGTYADATQPHENSVAVAKNAYNNSIEHGNEINERWKKVYFSQNMTGSFYTLNLDRTYPYEDLESVIVYNVKWSDDIRFAQSYIVLLDADDNEITDRISNNNGNTAYHYYKYHGPSHDKNTNQSDVPSTEKMLNDNMQKLIKKKFSLKSHKWQFCNFNDPGVGFPRDCGSHGAVGGMWMSINRNRGWFWQQWSIGVTVNKYQYEQKLFNEKKEINDEEKLIKEEEDKAMKTNQENKRIVESRNKKIEKSRFGLELSIIVNGLDLESLTDEEKINLEKYVLDNVKKDMNIKSDELSISLFTGSIGCRITITSKTSEIMKERLDKFNNEFSKQTKILDFLKNVTGKDNLSMYTKVIQAGLDTKSTKPNPKNFDCHIRLPILSKNFVGAFAFKSNTITEVRAICPSLVVNRRYIDLGKFNSPGGDIGEAEDTEWQDCPKRCNEIKECVGYVKDKKNKEERKGCIYKKEMVPSKMEEDGDYRSYLAKNNYEMIGKEDYKGNNIGVLDNVKTSSCSTLCDKTPECIGFVENTLEGKGCFLKSKFGNRSSDGKKTAFKKSDEFYEEITFVKKPLIAGDIIWPNRNGIKRYDNENSEKFTFTKLDSSIETSWSSFFYYSINTINTRGIEFFINNVSDNDDFYVIVDTTKDSNGLYINDGGLIGQLEYLGYISLGEDVALYEKGPFRTYKLKLKSSKKIKEYQKDELFTKKEYYFNELRIQQNKLSNIKISELQVWLKGDNIAQYASVQGTYPLFPKSLIKNIKNKNIKGDIENIYNSSFFEDSYVLVKFDKSYNFKDLEGVVVYIPEEEKEKFANNYIVLLDDRGNELTDRISNYVENQKYEEFIYKGPSYDSNNKKSNDRSIDKLLNEQKDSEIRKSSEFKIKDSIPLNNYISQSERFGEKNFGKRIFIYNQFKNKIFYKMNVAQVVDGISYVTKGYNIITRLDDNNLIINKIDYFFYKDRQFYIGVRNEIPIPYGPLYESYICGPNDPLCYPTPCRGVYTECNESCEKTYNIVSKPSLGGLECSIIDGSVEKCDPGEGKCPKYSTITIVVTVIILLLIISGGVYFIAR